MVRLNTTPSRPGSQDSQLEVLSTELERNYSYSTSSSSSLKEKPSVILTTEDVPAEGSERKGAPDMEQIALKALHVDDDPTLNPWTFRVFFIGWSFYCPISWKGMLDLTVY